MTSTELLTLGSGDGVQTDTKDVICVLLYFFHFRQNCAVEVEELEADEHCKQETKL